MERIHKALEKAREKRGQPGPQPRADSPRPRTAAKNVVPVEDIKYTQTQTIQVSQQALKEKRVVAHLKNDSVADLYKILRTKVLQRMNLNRWNVLAVVSPTIGSGKSLNSVNLAISLAHEGNHSVLLADLDFRQPSIHTYFGIDSQKGLIDYFKNDTPLHDLFIHPGIENLVVLPAGTPIRDSSELLSTPKMLNLSKELKSRYADRIIVIDLPPLLHSDDAMVFLPNVDAVLLVVAEGLNTQEDIERSLRLIDEKKYLGSILNRSDENWIASPY